MTQTTYTPEKGDAIDEEVGKVMNSIKGHIPVIRTQPGKYLIGTDVKMVKKKNNTLIVRVGGGWESLQGYVSRV